MPTAIEKIQAKAKALRKSYPNAKWTDLIKKASTELKKVGAIGGVSKKKKATKKAATKKTVSKRKPKIVKVLKQHGTSSKAYDKRHQALPAGRRISKSGRAYTETRSNRSDKGVLLGVSTLNDKYLYALNSFVKELKMYEKNLVLTKHKLAVSKSLKDPFGIKNYTEDINFIKKEIVKIKKHIFILKKLIK